jgi:hypothetical protein
MLSSAQVKPQEDDQGVSPKHSLDTSVLRSARKVRHGKSQGILTIVGPFVLSSTVYCSYFSRVLLLSYFVAIVLKFYLASQTSSHQMPNQIQIPILSSVWDKLVSVGLFAIHRINTHTQEQHLSRATLKETLITVTRPAGQAMSISV